jgi:hypothetical protein
LFFFFFFSVCCCCCLFCEVNEQRKSLRPGQFLEVSDGGDQWVLARVSKNDGATIQVMFLDETHGSVNLSNVRQSKMEGLFENCQTEFDGQTGFQVNQEQFRKYLFHLDLTHTLINNALKDSSKKNIQELISNFVMWFLQNQNELTQIKPSRFTVEPDDPQN